MSLIIPSGISGDLQAIAELTGTGVIKRTGEGTAALLSSTTTGESLLTATDATAVRTAIGSPSITYGTWTPAYSMSTSGSVTAETSTGEWMLLDNLCWFTGVLSSSSLSSPAGNVRLTIPFLPAATGAFASISIGGVGGWATAFNGLLRAFINPSTQLMILRKNPSNLPGSFVGSSDLNDGAGQNVVYFSGVYRIA